MAPNTTTDTIPEKASNEQVAELTQQTAAMVVSRAITGFFDLPGEIRNQIYGYYLGSWFCPTKWNAARSLMSTSQRIRSEFMSLWFSQSTIEMSIDKLMPFLLLFVGHESASGPKIQSCNIEVYIFQGWKNPTIDLKWLLELLYAHSEVKIKFKDDRGIFVKEVADLNKLFRIARTQAAWRSRLADFDTLSLEVYNLWNPAYIHAHPWVLAMAIKREAAASWWDNATEQKQHVQDILQELGVYKQSIRGDYKSSQLRVIRVRFMRYIIDYDSCGLVEYYNNLSRHTLEPR